MAVACALSGCRALVTGGAGTIGSTIVDQLLDAGVDHVVVVDSLERGRRGNLAGALERGRVSLRVGDIRDRRLMDEVTSGVDVLFHQAAIRITQCAEDPTLAVDVLVNGTHTVLDAARQHRVTKVVLASSASVYGLAETFPTTEDHHPWGNRTVYGAAKVFNEGLVRSFAEMYGLDYVALRYFNVYGPRMDVHGVYTEVLVRWMERIANGMPPLILGDGTQTMDFVYVSDVARANLLAASAPVTDEAINVACGQETSLNELADALLEAMGSALRPEYGPGRAVNPVTRRWGDTTKARCLLGFTSEVPLTEGLRRLVEWWYAERAAIGLPTAPAD